MNIPRKYVLASILVFFTVLATLILFDVLGTVFFAITVAYLLIPLHQRLVDRGIPTWWSSLISTVLAFVGVILLLAPIFLTLYLRRDIIISFVYGLPRSVTLDLLGQTYVIDADLVVRVLRNLVSETLLVSLVSILPILAVKLMLFVLVVFALLIRHGDARKSFFAVVPGEYTDVVERLEGRARSVLYAIYVIQAATAVATFVIALPIFFVFGYKLSITLALLCGILQFIPVVGPSVVILSVAAYEVVLLSAYTKAALLAGVGLVLIGWLPDAVIRPRLARRTARLPGSLYFIGFTGGILSLGFVGIIAGPLIVALTTESMSILSEENNKEPQERSDEESESGEDDQSS